MIRVLIAIALTLSASVLAGSAAAQTIRVQAGEHDGFTRIVLRLDAPRAWTLNRSAEGYDVTLDGPATPFDLSTVFRIIPKTRVQAVWSDPASGRLRLRIGCACHAVPFEFRPDILVIDVKDGPAEPGRPYERAADGSPMPPLAARDAVRLRPRPAPVRGVISAPNARPEVAPIVALPMGLPTLAPLTLGLPLTPQEPPATPAQDPSRPALPPDLSQMQDVLVQELARAASAGVIETDAPIFPQPAPAEVAPSLQDAGAAAHLGLPGLSARPGSEPPPAVTARGAACLPDSAVDVSSWSDGTDFAAQVAQLRSKLLGEFDRPDPAQTERLVKLMLHAGFGAEARNLLQSFPLQPATAELLRALADIMDGGSAPAGSPLAGQWGCPGAVALWASLAVPKLPASEKVDADAVARTFSALPVHLRRYLGPILAERFLGAGDVSTAQRIRDAIWRAPGDPGDAAQRIDGQLAARRGELEQAEESFAAVSRGGGPEAARALIELVDTRLALGQMIDVDTLTEIAAYRHEQKGGPLEPLLRRAEILARGASGDFDGAFQMAADAPAGTLRDLWALLAKAGPDSSMLNHAVLENAADLPPVDSVTAERIGTRLLELGFPDEALLWLPPDNAVQVAEAELMHGDARAALRAIAGLTATEAEAILGKALSRLGDDRAAAAAFAAAGDDTARTEALWRAERWAEAAPPAPDPRRETVERLAPFAPTPEAGPLAQATELVAESAATRTAIRKMLDSLPSPAGAEPSN